MCRPQAVVDEPLRLAVTQGGVVETKCEMEISSRGLRTQNTVKIMKWNAGEEVQGLAEWKSIQLLEEKFKSFFLTLSLSLSLSD